MDEMENEGRRSYCESATRLISHCLWRSVSLLSGYRGKILNNEVNVYMHLAIKMPSMDGKDS